MRQVNEVVLHATATRKEWWAGQPSSAKVEEVRRWHMEERGWSDIGYHFLIDRDGTVIKGRPVRRAGAHVRGHNANTIGIALFGGHGASATDTFDEHFTPEQDQAARDLVQKLAGHYGRLKLSGHNEYANKGCPGFNVAKWYARLEDGPDVLDE